MRACVRNVLHTARRQTPHPRGLSRTSALALGDLRGAPVVAGDVPAHHALAAVRRALKAHGLVDGDARCRPLAARTACGWWMGWRVRVWSGGFVSGWVGVVF